MSKQLTLEELARTTINPMMLAMLKAGRFDDALVDRESGEVFTGADPEFQAAINDRIVALAIRDLDDLVWGPG